VVGCRMAGRFAAGESRRQKRQSGDGDKDAGESRRTSQNAEPENDEPARVGKSQNWRSQWTRQKARAPKSAAGDPEVQRTVDAGYSSAAQLTMQGPVEVESSPQACERDSAAQAEGFKPQAQ